MYRSACVVLFTWALAACGGGGGSTPQGPLTPQPTKLGDPIAGLTLSQLASFERGRVMFEKEFRPSEGLGPFYNATSCASCHSTPITGGSARLYRNFVLVRYGNPAAPGVQFDLPGLPSAVMPAFGPSVPHTSAQFTLQGGRYTIPESPFSGFPVQVAHRNAIPVFGTGLFERISNATILANEDPNDSDMDGISGRANHDFGGTVGRFGVKSQSNNIELFTRAPLQNQMGITSNPFNGSAGAVGLHEGPGVFQVSASPNDPTVDNDIVPDPEISRSDLGDLIAFSRFLAPPQPLPFDAAATRGEVIFNAIGCDKCHIPSLDSDIGPVRAFTDLLLHDLGPDLADGMALGTPSPHGAPMGDPTAHREFRTQPLWGVSMHAPFLHDGRAKTLDEAIMLHGGEAMEIRDAYAVLTQQEKDDLLHMLGSL